MFGFSVAVAVAAARQMLLREVSTDAGRSFGTFSRIDVPLLDQFQLLRNGLALPLTRASALEARKLESPVTRLRQTTLVSLCCRGVFGCVEKTNFEREETRAVVSKKSDCGFLGGCLVRNTDASLNGHRRD
mmetsp:Transcript_6707/g.16437  ORF Transcript_6707/g.16437 Transcript_6707/m.16437 type:complete len:131 (+) Transcript_6707:3070-3462(+)